VNESKSESAEILILGDSVIASRFSHVDRLLYEQISWPKEGNRRIWNLAAVAHSSLDSYHKYRYLADKAFDLIVLYHGINETRANNVPPDVWRDDYGHYSWYQDINFFFGHAWLQKQLFVLPYFLRHVAINVDRKILHRGHYVPTHSPRDHWTEHGGSIKSARSLRNNLDRIIRLAQTKQEKVLLMTFAYYLPGNYTMEEFERNELGYVYSPMRKAVEIWGTAEHVVRGIERHNEVIRDLASQHDVMFVDQERLLRGHQEYFVDICHLSTAGARRFAEQMLVEINTVDMASHDH